MQASGMASMQRRACPSSAGVPALHGTHLHAPTTTHRPRGITFRRALPSSEQPQTPQGNAKPAPTAETGAALKAVWYAAETFGKVVGSSKQQPPPHQPAGAPAVAAAGSLSRADILQAIQQDYDSQYFISGKGDMRAYDDQCVFADPFVSFKGTERFKQNVGNLGGMMRDVKLDVYEFKELSDSQVQTRWRFSCVLDLPWRPLLAAAGGTTHVLDLSTGKVVQHIEQWDVEPGKVVGMLLRPANKMPTSAAETFMLSLSEGDVPGMWLAGTPTVVLLTLPVVAASLVCKLATGEGLPGTALGALEGVSWALLLGAAGTELYKLVKGAVGGEQG